MTKPKSAKARGKAAMKNNVQLAGEMVAPIRDYPGVDGKRHMFMFGLKWANAAVEEKKGKSDPATVAVCKAYGEVADQITSLELREGDLLSVEGYLHNNFQRGNCGRYHRWMNVGVKEIFVLRREDQEVPKGIVAPRI